MAAYPSCNQNNETQWLHENNITVKFSASFFVRDEKNLYLDTAVLRLYKLNPHNTTNRTTRSAESNDCDQPPMDAQIRVTVSTIQAHRRNRRDRKKRICNTVMLNSSHRGWVEIDVKRAINIWDKFDKQSHDQNHNNTNDSKPVMVGWLTIEVHDEEERPLKPGLYFEPPKCSQAYPALPWNAYRIYYTTPADMEKVPKSPRLDVKLIDLRGLRSSTLKRSRTPLDFNAFDYLNFDQSYTQTDCNQTHIHHHHGHHNIANEHEFNHHNNSVNPEDILYYADKKLNATAKKRIDEILFSTVSALAPYVSSAQYEKFENSGSTSSSSSSMPSSSLSSSSSLESKHHIKRHILNQQIQQHLQQQQQRQHNHQQQQQQHHHEHHNHNRNNGRRHIRQKRQNNISNTNKKINLNSNTGKNSLNNDDYNSIINNSTSILMRKLRQ
ncbi:protein anachronism-like [Condylostylus longicornis]|uniref:protein anachronism-like n=1 Tax=Condylostylus longicornis TaxID=2530218 RepID=UPI00244E1B49|nr:protein anachronism-like [Condylostylus longicornis]